MEIEKLLEVTAHLTRTDPGELVSALKGDDGNWKDDALDDVKGRLGNHIQSIGENQYKRGLRERGTDYERALRENFGDLPKDLQGPELVAALADKIKSRPAPKAAPQGGQEVDIDSLFTRPEAQQRLAAAIAEATSGKDKEVTTLREELERTKREYEQAGVKSTLKSHIAEAAQRHRIPVIVSGNDELSERRMRTLQNLPEFAADRWKIGEDGKPFPVDQKGQPLYHPKTMQQLTFDDILLSANPFGVDVYDSSHADTPAPNQGKGEASPAKWKFNNATEFVQAREKALAQGDRAKAKEMSDSWAARQR